MNNCPKCGTPVQETQKFCSRCGSPVGTPEGAVTCRACGKTLPANQKFCSGCGAAVNSSVIAPEKKESWLSKHKLLVGVIAAIAVAAVALIVILASGNNGDDYVAAGHTIRVETTAADYDETVNPNWTPYP